MKNILLISCLLFSLFTYSQKDKGTVTLSNGNVVSGLVKVASDKITFKSNKSAKAVKYDYTQAKSATITNKKGKKDIYEFIQVEKEKKPRLFLVIVDGFLRLYSESFSFNTGRTASSPGGSNISGESFYVKKQNEATAHYFRSKGNVIARKGFKKVIEDYFSDCSELQKKVENKEFKKKDYKEIVEYYNQNCAPKE